MAERDYVGEYLAKRNAIDAAKPHPLVVAGILPQSPTEPRPARTGNPVRDAVNLHNWQARSAPNPLTRQRRDMGTG